MVSLFEWLKNLFSHDAVQRTRLPIAKDNDLTRRSGIAARADQHYVRLYFSELFLQKDREWFTSRFPLGYSLISHKYGDQPKVEFANVAGKNKFDIHQASQDRSILRNYPMTPLLPFRGGDIEIDCGLVSMQASNLLESYGKPLDNAVQAKLGGRDDEAKLLLVQAKVAAMMSPDLTRRDGKRVVAAIDALLQGRCGDPGDGRYIEAARRCEIDHYRRRPPQPASRARYRAGARDRGGQTAGDQSRQLTLNFSRWLHYWHSARKFPLYSHKWSLAVRVVPASRHDWALCPVERRTISVAAVANRQV